MTTAIKPIEEKQPNYSALINKAVLIHFYNDRITIRRNPSSKRNSDVLECEFLSHDEYSINVFISGYGESRGDMRRIFLKDIISIKPI